MGSCGFMISETAPTEGRFGALDTNGKFGMAGIIGKELAFGRVGLLVELACVRDITGATTDEGVVGCVESSSDGA